MERVGYCLLDGDDRFLKVNGKLAWWKSEKLAKRRRTSRFTRVGKFRLKRSMNGVKGYAPLYEL